MCILLPSVCMAHIYLMAPYVPYPCCAVPTLARSRECQVAHWASTRAAAAPPAPPREGSSGACLLTDFRTISWGFCCVHFYNCDSAHSDEEDCSGLGTGEGTPMAIGSGGKWVGSSGRGGGGD